MNWHIYSDKIQFVAIMYQPKREDLTKTRKQYRGDFIKPDKNGQIL